MAVRVKFSNRGFYDIRRQPALVAQEEKIANGIAQRCNRDLGEPNGFRTGSRQGMRRPQGRWRTTVITVTRRAKRHNAKHNTLLKNLKG